MIILGISCYYHDSAAALLKDGEIVAAVQEERLTRVKHDADFPNEAIVFCLKKAKVSLKDVDAIVYYEKPFVKFERILETFFSQAPRGFWQFFRSLPRWLKEKLYLKKLLVDELRNIDKTVSRRILSDKILFSEHHLSHAASAYYPSPFSKAAIVTLDGVGEWVTTSLAVGNGEKIDFLKEIHFPHSLGLLYSAFTYYLGFKVNGGEYKVMGLAPYGTPRYVEQIYKELLYLAEDGSFQLNLKHFDYLTGATMIRKSFEEIFSQPRRLPESEVLEFHMDIAASIQQVIEEVILKISAEVHRQTGLDHLCLAGGVALNCVANGKLLKQGLWKNIWVQPAAGDAGGALGAALAAHFLHFKNQRAASSADSMHGSLLGPEYSAAEIETFLNEQGIQFRTYEENDLLVEVVEKLIDQNVVGWHQGKMEFGPRALGARSILADPRDQQMQKRLNLKIKYRESFRPFAPAIAKEESAHWFDMEGESPYMLMVADVKKEKRHALSVEEQNLKGFKALQVPRSEVPAITHVDYSARVQTVDEHSEPLFRKLLLKFQETTGCPLLVNTSFNVRGEPIVCSPYDSLRCFMSTEMDVLVLGPHLIEKTKQTVSKEQFERVFPLD
ncbi:MAG: carbamoyltransferase [Bdellovibrionales bacterium]|nr:carbamoyltransferase [Bdellovibrionales bacterium]